MNEAEAGPACTITVDLAALARNWRSLAAKAGLAECAAVVKADAYGIGIAEAVPVLAAAGCRTYFVALPEEGLRVREAAHGAVIYVLNGLLAAEQATYRSSRLRPVLNQVAELEAWAAMGGGAAALQVDTGMNRLGFTVEQALALRGSQLLAGVNLQLIAGHLACADEPRHSENARQLAAFRKLRAAFSTVPASFANSAGIQLGPDFHFDLVRPGIALYGGFRESGTEPVVRMQARVLQVREAAAGDPVGYGAGQRLQRPARLAILAAGYADGYLRAAGSSDGRPGACVLIGGGRAPLVGRVSMDLMAADVTDCPEPVQPGDLAELFGPDLPLQEVAEAAGTIPYEFLTRLSRRARRIYLGAEVGR